MMAVSTLDASCILHENDCVPGLKGERERPHRSIIAIDD